MNATIEASTTTEWWQQLPWESIALWFLIFWLGTIYADLMSEKSDIKSWIDNRFKKFKVVSFTPSCPPNTKNVITPRVKIRFLKKVESNVRIIVDEMSYVGGFSRSFSSEIFAIKEYKKDDELIFDLATIDNNAGSNSEWNCKDNNEKKYRFCSHNQYNITVVIGNQKHCFYIKHFNPNAYEQGIVFLLEESRDVWKEGNEQRRFDT